MTRARIVKEKTGYFVWNNPHPKLEVTKDVESIQRGERERIIALMISWNGTELTRNARGNYDPEALRELFQPQPKG